MQNNDDNGCTLQDFDYRDGVKISPSKCLIKAKAVDELVSRISNDELDWLQETGRLVSRT